MDATVNSSIGPKGYIATKDTRQRSFTRPERIMSRQEMEESTGKEHIPSGTTSAEISTGTCVDTAYPSGPGSASGSTVYNYCTENKRNQHGESLWSKPRTIWPQGSYEQYVVALSQRQLPENTTSYHAAVVQNREAHSKADKPMQTDNVVERLEMASLQINEKESSIPDTDPHVSNSVTEALLCEHEQSDFSTSVSSDVSSVLVDRNTMEKYIEPILTGQRQRLMTSTMDYWYSLTTSEPIFVQAARQRNETGSDKSTAGTSQRIGASKNDASQGSKRRSSEQDQEEGNDHDGDDGDEEKPPKRQRWRFGLPVDGIRKFACPYYKRRPNEHVKYGACSGPGFPSVHRLKEHLYRRHYLFECPRCGKLFDAQKDVVGHLAMADRCGDENDVRVIDDRGFSKDQEQLLRKKSQSHQPEEEKWKEVYGILFPDDAPGTRPSPYLIDGHTSTIDEETREADIIARYEDLCRRELPQIVQAKLDEVVDEEITTVLEKIKGRFLDIVKLSQDELFDRVKGSPPVARFSSEYQTLRPNKFGFAAASKEAILATTPQARNEDSTSNSLDWIPTDSGYHSYPGIGGARRSLTEHHLDLEAKSYPDITSFHSPPFPPLEARDDSNLNNNHPASFTTYPNVEINIPALPSAQIIPHPFESTQFHVDHSTPTFQPIVIDPHYPSEGIPLVLDYPNGGLEPYDPYPHFDYFQLADGNQETSL